MHMYLFFAVLQMGTSSMLYPFLWATGVLFASASPQHAVQRCCAGTHAMQMHSQLCWAHRQYSLWTTILFDNANKPQQQKRQSPLLKPALPSPAAQGPCYA